MFFAAGGILRTRACWERLSPIDIPWGFDTMQYDQLDLFGTILVRLMNII
jgi:hypothetical protein